MAYRALIFIHTKVQEAYCCFDIVDETFSRIIIDFRKADCELNAISQSAAKSTTLRAAALTPSRPLPPRPYPLLPGQARMLNCSGWAHAETQYRT